MTTLRKASPLQKAHYQQSKPVYPLGYVALNVLDTTGGKHALAVEDLRGSWSPPDPVWEVRAPEGFHFRFDMTHSLLCSDLRDVKHRLDGAELERCIRDCGCGCEFDTGERTAEGAECDDRQRMSKGRRYAIVYRLDGERTHEMVAQYMGVNEGDESYAFSGRPDFGTLNIPFKALISHSMIEGSDRPITAPRVLRPKEGGR